jgi:cytosine/adenosine deaminase-related metal-dependent hydrolase
MPATMLRGGWVVAHRDGANEVLDGGCVVFEGSRVTFVGFPRDPECPRADVVHDLPGRLITPGLINLHCIANIDLQTLRIDVEGVGFPKSRAWFDDTRHVLSDEGFRVSARFAVATLLRNGSTTFANVTSMGSKRYDDPEVEPRALAAAAAEMGVRGYVAHNFQDHSRYDGDDGVTHVVHDAEKGRAGLRRALAFADTVTRDHGELVRPFLFPYTTETCSDELLRSARDAARERGITLRSHFAQYAAEVREVMARTGESPTERMARLGMLGPATTLTHAIYLRGHPDLGGGSMDADLRLLGESGTNVAHCPVVYTRRGFVLRSFDRYRRAGVNIGLGTDTAPADIVGEMRMAATVAKIVDGDARAGSAADVFHAATIAGADALGRPDLGRLQRGATADISVFDLRALHLGVIDCPIKALVHFASGADAEHVFVDGAHVMRDRDVVAIDDDAVLAEAQEVWGGYKVGLAARDPLGRSAGELYPSGYPIRRA